MAQVKMNCQDIYERTKKLVEDEIYTCVNRLVTELASQEKYMDELIDVCMQYDEEEDEHTEALEHWAVSDWLADHLEENGEMIIRDFLGLNIWGRTCSGQSIYLDWCMQKLTLDYGV